MASTETTGRRELELLRHQAHMAHVVVQLNVADLTHEDSLVQPPGGGNCLNWVVGHLLAIYHHVLPLLGQQPVMAQGVLARYDRGSPPIVDPADAHQLSELMAAWDECSRRVEAGLSALDPATLQRPAPRSPSNDPNETIGSLLSTISWHQAYHAGQTGLLRRAAGRQGAIR
jgi:uncharacterized damage-inducible protein DinB